MHKLVLNLNLPISNFIQDSAGRISVLNRSKSATAAREVRDDEGSPSRLDNWIPSEAMEMANNFRSNHGNDLSPELITELLKSLNKVWRDREKR